MSDFLEVIDLLFSILFKFSLAALCMYGAVTGRAIIWWYLLFEYVP